MSEALSHEGEMDSIEYEESGFSLTIQGLKPILHRQRKLFGLIVLVALVIGLLISVLTTNRYKAEVSIQIDQDRNDVIRDRGDEVRLRGNDVQRYLNSQIEIVKSRKMAKRVSENLKLNANDDFLTAMGVDQSEEFTGPEKSRKAAHNSKTLTVLIENVDIVLPVGSNVATISFESPSRKISQNVANAYAENLITGNIEQRYEATSYAREFLEKEIANSKQRLEESERSAIEYAQSQQIIDASDGVAQSNEGGAPRSITTANLVQMNTDLAQARTERIKTEEKWKQASQRSLMNIPDVLQNATIQSLLAERAIAEGRDRENLKRYKQDHPVALQSKAQVRALEQETYRLASNIRKSIRSEYEVSRKQEASLGATLAAMKKATLVEQTKRVELNLLAREVDTNRAHYQSLLERFKQVSASADVVTNNIVIIDTAVDSEKVAPKPLINILLAGLAGLVIAFFAAFIRELLDDSIKSPEDVSSKLGAVLLGTTPVYDGDDLLENYLSDRKSALAEAYASIQSSIEFSGPGGFPSSLLFTSSVPSEGKSTTSIAVAESLGRFGKRVLLVDADLRNPSLHQYLGLDNNAGFISMLNGTSADGGQIIKPEGMHIDLLPSGPIPNNPTEILAPWLLSKFINNLEDQYDHIIFDGPPVMGLADAPQLSRTINSTVFVVQANRGAGGQTKSALRRLADAKANVIGVVLSRFDGKVSGYGEYYGDYYSYRSAENPAKD